MTADPPRASPPLDVCVIGSTKSGTTTVFRFLGQHPNLYLPSDKEAPVFLDDDCYARDSRAFVEKHLGTPPVESRIGKVPPQYMEDSRRVTRRMAALFPECKLIAMLQISVDRAFSYWRMRRRHGTERRSFRETVKDQIRPRELERAPTPSSRPPTFTSPPASTAGSSPNSSVNSLGSVSWFGSGEALEERPDDLLDDLLRSLSLPQEFRPSNLGKRHHVGGSRKLFPSQFPWAQRKPLLRVAERRLPLQLRRSGLFWYRSRGEAVLRSQDREQPLDPETRDFLPSFYREDVDHLEQCLDHPRVRPELSAVR